MPSSPQEAIPKQVTEPQQFINNPTRKPLLLKDENLANLTQRSDKLPMADILRRLLILIPTVIALCYLVAVLWVFLFQERLIYEPGDRILFQTPGDFGLEFEDLTLTGEDDAKLHGWFIPSPADRGTVLFFHGNAGNISHLLDVAEMFHSWGLHVLLIDYHGYGQSEGKPSETATQASARAAWNFLVEEKNISENKIILHGRSLGAAIAADLATTVQPAGIILEAGFTALADVGAKLYPWLPVRFLSRHDYPTIENVTHFKTPVLVTHSRDDELIPFSHSEAIYAAAPEPKRFFEMHGSHGSSASDTGEPYENAVREFIFESLDHTNQSELFDKEKTSPKN